MPQLELAVQMIDKPYNIQTYKFRWSHLFVTRFHRMNLIHTLLETWMQHMFSQLNNKCTEQMQLALLLLPYRRCELRSRMRCSTALTVRTARASSSTPHTKLPVMAAAWTIAAGETLVLPDRDRATGCIRHKHAQRSKASPKAEGKGKMTSPLRAADRELIA